MPKLFHTNKKSIKSGIMDKLNKEQRRKNMQAVKSYGSRIEVLLAKELWKRGYRYRKNNKKVYGKPDFTFKKYKIAIFVDSEFWHGKDWDKKNLNINPILNFGTKRLSVISRGIEK